ncbi:MAG: DNA protecting protein DprA [Candidatus Taylorbacteria bacterium RIFCSPHIGHO2_02_FULL_45_28]|uniref:DNA protecting protein DprA n=1 Tax=Candidatus Taylorbacteria bacterium RIFCSPHIGHO2_12_FULL_45_16 TaxID=1802315 RepID=A0A1G2MYI5_9BACT|nr:MAG: DNA protecting protein DprA [Candidatus Taylorbacteria bacterium RIFCSPHIGHO2_01_FULL_44_110]OHA25115.1 MAG: DNA protecting protein DprA [Candidatus Taylorbacteria bacterium RIFCSPHIGHO2_02_FULL_45_28]OHA28996.1 MAG: DNA protecting protein DprA [Candidatus Taylorbacteria bacterium RIFCSPHIGHO2_12_FULL_45_16]OHA33114.1 MAG: DNA protecting protein DprA [Candidatus Taylorbacteria bacterium RIFCSPLOWO2_01_FULL_45_59]OHA39398.1 MAG: DNA protecting protein DprA [Candidatus Taylorbacteria bact
MNLTIYTITPYQYPELLQQIRPLPKQLYVAGTIPPDDQIFLCVIGSRMHSAYGKEACRKIILGLHGQPVVIVSGMAVGIDSIAHEAALEAGLKTVAFPGSGLSSQTLYPPSRRNLAERILNSGGALISSFQPEQAGTIWTFPYRNRLMAGISHATLIIEGRQGSGTLGTATYATELGRDVMIVPGSIFSELSYGPLLLMKEGASPVTSAEDVLHELDFVRERLAKVERSPERLAATLAKMKKREETRLAGKTAIQGPQVDISQLVLSGEERTVYECLRDKPLPATDIMERLSMPVSIFNITVSELEMKGLVAQESGRYKKL